MAVTPPPVLKLGDSGSAVLDVQARLVALGYSIAGEHGTFGPQTESAVKVFQIRRGLQPDGQIGPHTWRELVEAGLTIGARTLYHRPRSLMRGDDIRDLQRRLNALGFDAGKQDGIFGVETEDAVAEFQRNVGLHPDGIAGHETFEALHRLRRRIGPGSKSELREQLAREAAVGLAGRVVFLDPGHGGADTGLVTAVGIPEAYLTYRVAEAAADHLESRGAKPLLSRAVQQGPDVDSRCEIANLARADLAVSFHLACRQDPGPNVAFWSVDKTHSKMGKELAESISGSMTERTGSSQVLGRNLPFLLHTRMPAVVVDLANPESDELFLEDTYLTALGEAVARGIETYFAG
jgi:N-acetylmuramoyl-L-alanine amidase